VNKLAADEWRDAETQPQRSCLTISVAAHEPTQRQIQSVQRKKPAAITNVLSSADQ